MINMKHEPRGQPKTHSVGCHVVLNDSQLPIGGLGGQEVAVMHKYESPFVKFLESMQIIWCTTTTVLFLDIQVVQFGINSLKI